MTGDKSHNLQIDPLVASGSVDHNGEIPPVQESVFLALVGARYEDGGHVLSVEDARVLTLRVGAAIEAHRLQAVTIYRDLIDRSADQMVRECKHPPCEHAAGLRLALSYMDEVRLFTTPLVTENGREATNGG